MFKPLQKLYNLTRPVLSDTTIRKMILNDKLVLPGENGPSRDMILHRVQPHSVDLSLAKEASVIKHNDYMYQEDEAGYMIDAGKPINYDDAETFEGRTIIRPGEFLIMSTNEIISVPKGYVAHVYGKSSVARMGIQVEQASLINSGFHGNITLEVFNQTEYPILFKPNMLIAQVVFHKAQFSSAGYGASKFGSKYNGQSGTVGSRIDRCR